MRIWDHGGTWRYGGMVRGFTDMAVPNTDMVTWGHGDMPTTKELHVGLDTGVGFGGCAECWAWLTDINRPQI